MTRYIPGGVRATSIGGKEASGRNGYDVVLAGDRQWTIILNEVAASEEQAEIVERVHSFFHD